MPAGQPTKLTPEVAATIRRLAPLGLTDVQLSAVLGINELTLNRWKKDPGFCKSLKEDKASADVQVKTSLYKQALDGNTTAAIFWLKNRDPERWRDKTEVAITGIEDIFKAMDDAR